MKVELLSIVYGKAHIELFQRACLKTLSFPENKKSIYKHVTQWNICTEPEFTDHLRRIIDAYFPELKLNFILTEDLRQYTDPIQSAIISQIKSCLETNSRLLFAPPDNLFSDGTIGALILAGREEKTVVVVPHPRVLPSILDTKLGVFMTSPEMVKLSWQHLHQSWTDAEVGHIRQNSFVGGVKWWKTNDKTIAGQHYLPTPFLMDFTEEDLQYFSTQISFGSFDHVWPNDVLLQRGRQRFVGSSDACFIAEITERDKNVPPIWDGSPDNFWRANSQFLIDKQMIFTFRSE